MRTVDVQRPTPFTLDAPIAVEVRGHDLEVLAEVAEEVRRRMEGIDGLTDVRTTVRPGHPEARITFDRDKTLEYGLDLAEISSLIQERAFLHLEAPVKRCAGFDTPFPYTLEMEYLPLAPRILEGIHEVLEF